MTPGAAIDPTVAKRGDVPRRVGGRPENQTEDDDVQVKKKGGIKILVKAPVKAPEEKKERVKLTINNAFDDQQRERSLASLKRKRASNSSGAAWEAAGGRALLE